jgi:Glyoxalase-like domain
VATAVQVTFDSADPDRLANFWAAALDYKKQDPPEGFASWEQFLSAQGIPESEWNSASAIVDPDGVGPRIFFQRVPEPKTAKNRVHLDVNVGGGHDTPLDDRRRRVDAQVGRLTGAGATRLRSYEIRGEYWVVMTDIEGNEFCLQ